MTTSSPRGHFIETVIRSFVDSKLTPLIVLASLLLGLFAILATPREEEPQIIVPMMDVFVEMPGASIQEVESRVTIPMEKKLMEIPGVEYVYSISMPGLSMAVVRFYVGEDEEDSLVKLYNKLYSNFDLIPPGATQPLVKPRSIDDVPILALTLWGEGYGPAELRRLAAELDNHIKDIPDVSETKLIGGQRRQLKILLDPVKMAAHHVDPVHIKRMLLAANHERPAGSYSRDNTEFLVDVGHYFHSAAEVEQVLVGAYDGRPIYLRDVARVEDGPEEPVHYVFISPGPAASTKGIAAAPGDQHPAVTISIAKRKGTNAIEIVERVMHKVEQLTGRLIPHDVQVTVTRDYGETAQEKSDELLKHLMIAVVSVTLLIALFLGWRASLVVLVAVPVTLAFTLLVYYLYGYTLNRVTLFALIFSIGILVDDPIVDVENIVRHFQLPRNKGRSIYDIAVEAVTEVQSPLILATLTVIFAILPMAFVSGLMGPYMRPIPIGSSTAMLFSMAVAFVITPWAAAKLLQREREDEGNAPQESWTTRVYRRVMTPLIYRPVIRWAFLLSVGLLLAGAVALLFVKVVHVKMLPFDNKSEFQIIIDMPEGTALEKTAQVAAAIGDYLKTVPEVTDYERYVGTASPYNFNGLVRHYFLRSGPNVADIQVNLVPKHQRAAQSHDIAKRVRPDIQEIARRYGARVKIAEVPPGPPVLQTLVAEVYGPRYDEQIAFAQRLKEMFEQTPGVVDVDWYVEAPQPKYRFAIDRKKAALSGITDARIVETLQVALDGKVIGLLHVPNASEDIPVILRVPRAQRSSLEDLQALRVIASDGRSIPLAELVDIEATHEAPYIYRKNLKRVVYVTGDVAGEEESPVYAILKLNDRLDRMTLPDGSAIPRYATQQPFLTETLSLKWDGEWQITYEVFRDLGLAFGAVLVLIYILVVAWFQSFKTPLVILAPIPLSLIGILPAHAMADAFFTATSMIGFIAGAGIVVRNSIILIDFAELRRREGMPLAEAVIDAGAVRFRPMLLTASAVIVGSAVILFDPIFQGLAISLMAGEVAATLLTRMAVPILYYLSERGGEPAQNRFFLF
ncbi:MAG: efflux RND transporter permease subunit [Nitrospirae bacterium]|nr:MAG: efflux RND transporter permease subunit [Nitrospirota bacterium]